MDPERHRQIKSIVECALDQPTAHRDAYVRAACAGDDRLREDVARLLDALAESDRRDFLSDAAAGAVLPEVGSGEHRYRIVRELGRGGMGTVYLAERADGAFRQRVAIKLIGWESGADDQALRRFRTERQILADLEHPNIARLIDGGTLGDGRPYLVMEYVDGERIDLWCARHGLDTAARLRLFLKVCAAVSYAHRALVVHRDLKPGNILVDAAGEPKLLDFGIAKLLADERTATATGERLLTFGYASPEQVRGKSVGTASDVYSLGVLLYRLLTGRLPYRVPEDSMPALARAICEEEPTPASDRLRDPADADAPPVTLHLKLDRDLDEILLKALRKEPAARYASVEQYAQDVERFLDGLPVLARRGSRAYRVRKFVARHRFAVAAAFVFVALVLGFAFDRQRQLAAAEAERDRAQRLVAFMTGLFENADPEKAGGAKVTVAQVLDSAARRAELDDGQQPLDRAAMLHTIGSAYRALGAFDRAQALFEQARALRGAAPDSTLDTVASEFALAGVHQQRGAPDAAAPVLAAARERLVARFGADDWRVAEVEGRVAMLERDRGHGDAARAALDAAHAKLLRALGYTEVPARVDPDRPREALLALADLTQSVGIVAHDRKDWALAEPRLTQAIALRRQLLPPSDPSLTVGLSSLANLKRERGDLKGAVALREEILAIRERVYGPEHWQVGAALVNLGNSYGAMARHDEAREIAIRAAAILEKSLGRNHRYTLVALGNIGGRFATPEESEATLAHVRDVLARRRAVLPADDPDVALALYEVASTLARIGRLAEALESYHDSFEIYAKHYGPDHPWLDDSRISEADVLLALDRRPEAEARLRAVIAHDGNADASASVVASAKFRLAKLLGRGDEALALAHAAAEVGHREGKTAALDPAEVDAWLADVGRSAR